MTGMLPIDPAVSTSSDENAATVVSADIPCLTCEYNLRSHSIEGRCPECGQPVRDTLDHYQLVGQAGMLNELVGFATSMTTSLLVVSLALVGKFVLSQIPFGPFWYLIMFIFGSFYYITAMGAGVDIFRITKRPAFGHGAVVVFMCIIAIDLTLISSSPSPIYLIVSFFFSVALALLVGAPVWFAQHTKHLATLIGDDKLKSLAKKTTSICLVLPMLTLLYLGWSVFVRITGQPNLSLLQSSSTLLQFIVLTILLATAISSALLGFRLVAVAKKLHRTAKAMEDQSSINATDSA